MQYAYNLQQGMPQQGMPQQGMPQQQQQGGYVLYQQGAQQMQPHPQYMQPIPGPQGAMTAMGAMSGAAVPMYHQPNQQPQQGARPMGGGRGRGSPGAQGGMVGMGGAYQPQAPAAPPKTSKRIMIMNPDTLEEVVVTPPQQAAASTDASAAIVMTGVSDPAPPPPPPPPYPPAVHAEDGTPTPSVESSVATVVDTTTPAAIEEQAEAPTADPASLAPSTPEEPIAKEATDSEAKLAAQQTSQSAETATKSASPASQSSAAPPSGATPSSDANVTDIKASVPADEVPAASNTEDAAAAVEASRPDGDEEDDWESKDDSQLVIAKQEPAVSLRPGGGPGNMRFASAGKSAVVQLNPNKKTYEKDILMQFQDGCQARPASLPDMELTAGEGGGAAGKGGGGGGGKGAPGGGPDEWRRVGGKDKAGGPPGGKGAPGGAGGFADPRDPRNNAFNRGGDRGGDRGRRDDRGGKGGGNRGGRPGAPLLDVKPLEVNENRWKPASQGGEAGGEMDKLVRATKALLNKFTLDKYEKLSEQFLELEINGHTDMVAVIDLVFDKALFEPLFGEMYSALCSKCAEKFPEFEDASNPGAKPVTFKRLLLNKCQEEFEKENYVQAEIDALPEDAPVAAQNLIRSAAKKRMLGNIRFIGELFKAKMLTEKIMHECLIKLLGDIENPDDDEVECLCKLMTTIGKSIDHPKARSHMDEYFTRMKEMSQNLNLALRLRFMLQEVIDLRRGAWLMRKPDPSVKPPSSQDGQRGGKGAGRNDMSNARRLPDRGPPPSGKKAGVPEAEWSAARSAGVAAKGGKPGAGTSNTSSSARAEAPPAPAPVPKLTSDEVETKLKQELEEYLSVGDTTELATCLKELLPRAAVTEQSIAHQLAGMAIEKAFDARTDETRLRVAKIFGGLHKAKLLKPAEMRTCLTDRLEFIDDDVCDIPHIASYMALLIAHTIIDGVLSLNYVNEAFSHLVDTEGVTGQNLVIEILRVICDVQGAERAQQMYAEAKISWSTILPEDKRSSAAIAAMLETAKLGHLDADLKREVEKQQEEELKVQRTEKLRELDEHLRKALAADDATEEILQWMQEHCESTSQVARTVMRCVLECASSDDPPVAAKVCKQIEARQTLLKKYNDTGKGQGDPGSLARQAHCLFEVQRFCHDNSWPNGLMKKLFFQLYNVDVVFEDAYGVWREDVDNETPGKTQALFQVNEFLQWLDTAAEDEED